ncbi:hypothetical protein Poly41_40060 [Novipirellula artificiosorum]|uniref:HlyD family secretion protein n=1 Tax=Novipirellula artificiosorum TaxID=2528016 RepID=A0A5C6DCA2_9BACT|nr:hypothetical protein Poly41_40060 [Novipirellula artificiosorum]
MKSRLKSLIGPVVVVLAIAAMWLFRDRLFSQSNEPTATASTKTTDGAPEKQTILEISAQARKNLGLVAKAVRPQSYWRTILIPGEIADRPGLSDRGVTSPAVGIVTQIHAFPGDTMRPGEPLFTLRLFSEYLQNTQSELFQATREVELVQQQIARLADATRSGAVAESRLIELRNQLARQTTLIQAHQQDLLTRGLSPQQVQQVAGGNFVSTIEVTAPPALPQQAWLESPRGNSVQQASFTESADAGSEVGIAYEVQELSVELGQQVQAGQLLGKLSNHGALYIVGHAFKREAPYLEKVAQEQRSIDVEFAEDVNEHWPDLEQPLHLRHMANSIDSASRTFDFFIPLINQSRSYEQNGETFLVWRFRPGQRTRLHVPVELYEDVLVLPAEAVVHEGPESYVFRQNGDLFKRLPVHVLYEDRQSVVIHNDGSIPVASYLAQSGAASLNRVLKAQSASGQQPGVHVHADGTSHAAH